MAAPSTFSTSRLLLRRPRPDDAAAVFEFASDPLVVRYMDWPAALELADTMRVNERAIQNWESGEEYSWRLTVPPSDTPIGSIGCRIKGATADFGFVLNHRYRGLGYATEADQRFAEGPVQPQRRGRVSEPLGTRNRCTEMTEESGSAARSG